MSLIEILETSEVWLTWLGLGLLLMTIISFIFSWGIKFRLIGTTVFTFLLSVSCWTFTQSYNPTLKVEGAKYVPIVYDNGFDLVVAQAPNDFPDESIIPTLEQVAGNLKGGIRNGSLVHVRIRKLVTNEEGISTPIVLGEVIRDIRTGTTKPLIQNENEY